MGNYSFLSPDDDKCETCEHILEELETIDDDTDKEGIQFVKSKDAKLAAEIGIFSFPALVYYETGVPIMYNGKLYLELWQEFDCFIKSLIKILENNYGIIKDDFHVPSLIKHTILFYRQS